MCPDVTCLNVFSVFLFCLYLLKEFYENQQQPQITISGDLPETFEHCAEMLKQNLLSYQSQADDYYNSCLLGEFIHLWYKPPTRLRRIDHECQGQNLCERKFQVLWPLQCIFNLAEGFFTLQRILLCHINSLSFPKSISGSVDVVWEGAPLCLPVGSW